MKLALHTCIVPIRETKLWEETTTARTKGMPNNEGMRGQPPPGEVGGGGRNFEVTSTEVRWTGQEAGKKRTILTNDRNASGHQRAGPTRRNLKELLIPRVTG